MRCADPRSGLLALLAGAALWLQACTGPGLEPPGDRGNDLGGPIVPPPEGPGAGVGTGGTGGGPKLDAGEAPPAVMRPDQEEPGEDAGSDGGLDGGVLDGGDADLDAGVE